MFITRPIKAGTKEFKQMMRAILRCRIQTPITPIPEPVYSFDFTDYVCEVNYRDWET